MALQIFGLVFLQSCATLIHSFSFHNSFSSSNSGDVGEASEEMRVLDSVAGQIYALLMPPQAAMPSHVRSADECPFHSASLYVSACMRVTHVPLNYRRMRVCLLFEKLRSRGTGGKTISG